MTRIGWEPGDFGDERPSISIDASRSLLGYSRNSAERLLGVFGQDVEIVEWAEQNGYEVVGHARDVKVHSQSPVEERRGLSAVVEAVEQGHVGGVVVYKLDRLARNWEVQEDAIQKIWRAGGRVFSTDYGEWKPDKPGQPQWHLRRKYAEIAESEYHALLSRLQDGRRRKMARGGYGGGRPFRRPYGRELVADFPQPGRTDYRPVAHEQAVIREICAACRDGKGYAAMAKTLNERGEPTVSGAPWSTKVVRGLALQGPVRLSALPKLAPDAEPIQWVQRATA